MDDSETSRTWRPRFSLRVLLGAILIAALYMATGPSTRKGKQDVIEYNVKRNSRMMDSTTYLAPLLYECRERSADRYKKITVKGNGGPGLRPPVGTVIEVASRMKSTCTYYVWFFGSVAKLPLSIDCDFEVYDSKTNEWVAE